MLAEEVERADPLEFLERELCDEAQVNLLGRPGNIEGFRELTHRRARPMDVPRGSKASSKR